MYSAIMYMFVFLLQVVCSQVSCGAAVKAPCCAQFGQGTGPIWLDNVQCTAQDEFLEQCGSNDWGVHNCGHGEDASVICGGNCTVDMADEIAFQMQFLGSCVSLFYA